MTHNNNKKPISKPNNGYIESNKTATMEDIGNWNENVSKPMICTVSHKISETTGFFSYLSTWEIIWLKKYEFKKLRATESK